MTVTEFVSSNPGSTSLAALLGIFYLAMFIFIWLQDRRIVLPDWE